MESTGSLLRIPAMRQLVIFSVFAFTSYGLTIASLPLYAVRQGATRELAGLVTTVMLVATVMLQTAVPALVRRFGVGPVIAVGLVALGGPTPFFLLSDELGSLLVLSAVRGLGFAILTVLGSTLTAQIAPIHRRGEGVGIYGLAVGIPSLVAVPAGAALVASGDFAWVAFLAASPILAIPSALLVARAVRSSQPPAARGGSRGAVVSMIPATVVLLIVTLAGGGLITFLPIEIPAGYVAPVALLLFGVTTALGRWRVGILADSMGTRVLLPATLLCAAVGLAAVAIGLASETSAPVLVGATLFGIGYGAAQNLTLLVAFERAGPAHATTASAVWNAGFDSGTAVGALAVGALAGAITLPGSYGVCVALLLLALCLPGRPPGFIR